MNKILKKYQINAEVEKVWDALTKPEVIERWGAGPNVIMDAKAGGEFKLWNGDIWGENVEVRKNKRLVQKWYGGNWKEASDLVINLKYNKNEKITEVELIHSNLPEGEVENFSKGWDEYYFGAIKELLES